MIASLNRTPTFSRAPVTALLAAVALVAFPWVTQAQSVDGGSTIPSPEEFFGHVMGADRQLARWDRLVDYYRMLGEASDRIVVEEVGLSTLGNPFLVIYVSSPENLANRGEIQRMNDVLSDPRGHAQADVDYAIENSKVVFVQAYACLLYTSPSPRDQRGSRMPSSA